MGRGRRLEVKGHALAVAEDLLCELQNAPLTWMSLLNVSPSTVWFPSIVPTRLVCVTIVMETKSVPPPERPYLKLPATDEERAEIESIDASIYALPERLGGDDATLIGVLDAMRKYYEANPQLAKLEIENVPDEASSRLKRVRPSSHGKRSAQSARTS